MKKVMIFGKFNEIEKRHHDLFQAALDHGDSVIVVLSRDDCVVDMSEGSLTENELKRFTALMAIDVIDDIVLAHGNHIDIVRTHRPHTVLIGAHQTDLANILYDVTDELHDCNCFIVRV
ncbi:MAG: hypothetical protein CR972_01870 [Candidatus Moraniibacteriota bacterium]|nr:MAG: hypothetical protein CR972_01870 [Candidatus Moranbacteria bacterium]